MKEFKLSIKKYCYANMLKNISSIINLTSKRGKKSTSVILRNNTCIELLKISFTISKIIKKE